MSLRHMRLKRSHPSKRWATEEVAVRYTVEEEGAAAIISEADEDTDVIIVATGGSGVALDPTSHLHYPLVVRGPAGLACGNCHI